MSFCDGKLVFGQSTKWRTNVKRNVGSLLNLSKTFTLVLLCGRFILGQGTTIPKTETQTAVISLPLFIGLMGTG